MKSLVMLVLFSMFLVSCSHTHEATATNKANVLEVRMADGKHAPKIGENIKVFNWVCEMVNKGTRSQRWSCNRENEVVGTVSEVVSNELIKVQLSKDFNATKDTFADVK